MFLLEPGLDPVLTPYPGPWPRVALPSLPPVLGEAQLAPWKDEPLAFQNIQHWVSSKTSVFHIFFGDP